jgi:hypothetical protein
MPVQYRQSADPNDRAKGVKSCRPGEVVKALKPPHNGWIEVDVQGQAYFLPINIGDKVYIYCKL